MSDEWKPLIYDDLDFSEFFSYNDDGDILNVKTNRKVKQQGNSVVLAVEGQYYRINRQILLNGFYKRPERPDKGKKRKPQITTAKLEEMIEQKVKLEVAKQLYEMFKTQK